MRETSLLGRIYHASPCAASWEEMSGDDRVRFCGQCGRHVYNLSAMLRREAERLIRDKEGMLCARFFRRRDGTVITRDCWTPVREWSRGIGRAANTALSAVLGFSTLAAWARQPPCKDVVHNRSRARLSYAEAAAATFATVAGTVRDATNTGIEGTSIELTRLGTDKKYRAVSNNNGRFSLEQVEPGLYSVRVEAPGFQSYRAEKIRLRGGEKLQLEVDLAVGSVGGCALLPAPSGENRWA
jgi:hypothetical protein